MTPNYTFMMDSGAPLPMLISNGVFFPTYTSTLCITAARAYAGHVQTILDLGCGCGVVGIALSKLCPGSYALHGSDISAEAVETARQNYALHGLQADLRVGAVFEPWSNMDFDLIIDDVSGIAEDVAEISPWFSGNIPCATGPDGADLTLQVIEDAPTYLTSKGGILLPIISLSNQGRILAAARKQFADVSEVATQTWKMPGEMTSFLPQLRRIKKEGRIHFEERFGAVLCKTDIYYCTNANKE